MNISGPNLYQQRQLNKVNFKARDYSDNTRQDGDITWKALSIGTNATLAATGMELFSEASIKNPDVFNKPLKDCTSFTEKATLGACKLFANPIARIITVGVITAISALYAFGNKNEDS